MKTDTRFNRQNWEKKWTGPVDRDILEVIDLIDNRPTNKRYDEEKKKEIEDPGILYRSYPIELYRICKVNPKRVRVCKNM